MDNDYIVNRAITILRRAAENIEERGKSYNSNDVNYQDYMIRGVDSAVENILECIVRLWNSKADDKAEDACAYLALMTAFIQEGMPVSRFAPIFNKLIPELRKAIRIDDIRTGELIDGDYRQRVV